MFTLYMHYEGLDVDVDEARAAKQGRKDAAPGSGLIPILRQFYRSKRSWCGSMASRGLGSRQVMRVEVASR
ncbi:hypothetical protein OFB58_27100, partial [Escherichia coli]|nr:hypothetical protein [Escherichia coli]